MADAKQLCRLPYDLCKDGKTLKRGYLLSAKDFDLSKRLSDLKNAGVDVLKIEGRARRPYYVATATKQYRNLLDGKPADYQDLKLAFNRGFTQGYFDGNGKIISDVQNHIGVPVGKVLRVVKRKTYKEIYFYSSRVLSPKSTFKFFNGGVESAVLTAYDLKPQNLPNINYMLTTTQNVQAGDQIRLISDLDLELKAKAKVKKVNIPIKITLEENQPVKAEFTVNGNPFTVLGDECLSAQNRPLEQADVEGCFKKSEFFDCDISTLFLGKVFLVKKQLNEFRRRVFFKMTAGLTLPYKHDQALSKADFDQYLLSLPKAQPFTNFSWAKDLDQVDGNANDNVIFSPDFYDEQTVESAKNKCLELGKNFILYLPPFALQKDVEFLANLCEKHNLAYIANNYYALNFKGKKIIGGGLNVYNSVTASLHGAPFITAEMSCESLARMPYMTLRHCPYKNHLGASCDNCPHADGYALKMQSGKTLKIRRVKMTDCTFYLTD